MRKVNDTGDPCCEIVDDLCLGLDEICYLVPEVSGFHYTEHYDDGTDAVLFQGPATGPAWVRVIVTTKNAPVIRKPLSFVLRQTALEPDWDVRNSSFDNLKHPKRLV